ncbi:MAG: hypothetical protein WBC73_16885 [Phormidesmis sp.]
MFISCVAGAQASTNSVGNSADNSVGSPGAAFCSLPPEGNGNSDRTHAEPVRHMLFGSLPAVRSTIRHLHKLGYAEPNDWSQPISTGRSNEVTAILTKRVRISSS